MRVLGRRRMRALPDGARFGDGRDVRAVVAELIDGPVSGVHVLNHHGLLSLRVDGAAQRYKVFECESRSRARLAATALELVAAASGPVPGLVGRSGAVLATEWVEGMPCSHEPSDAQKGWLLQCQLALAQTAVPADAESGGYVHLESLVSRLRERGALVLGRSRVETVVTRLWEMLPPQGEPHIIHPDLTPANVVLTDGGPFIIDNEAIAVAHGREFDVWNTGEALYGRRSTTQIESYVAAFAEHFPLPGLYEYRTAWDRFRVMRQGLKALEKKRFVKAARLLRSL